MFACAADDETAPRSTGCLCHGAAFARLNARLTEKFSRTSSIAAASAAIGAFAAGAGSTRARAAAEPAALTVFTNALVFDGKSDALLSGLRVVVQGAAIKAIEPVGAAAGADVETIDCGGRVLMPGLIDAHWHAMMAAVPLERADDRRRRLPHPGGGGRSEENADARLHQRSRHGRPELLAQARDRRAASRKARASGRPAR